MKIYKIYNKKTQKYSFGGVDLKETKGGKIWNKLSNIKLHLAQFVYTTNLRERFEKTFKNHEVVIYEMIEIDRTAVVNFAKDTGVIGKC